jgi:hypothetical protein
MDTITLKGLSVALQFARCGRFIFAIKYIEKENPGISREDAIAAVASFGYREQVWRPGTCALTKVSINQFGVAAIRAVSREFGNRRGSWGLGARAIFRSDLVSLERHWIEDFGLGELFG